MLHAELTRELTPQDPPAARRPESHTVEIDFAEPDQMAEFLVALSRVLRARRRVRITIE
jgi:hypothetical protein